MQKIGNYTLFFVDHLLQKHLSKNQIDLNKLNTRELENEQKNRSNFRSSKNQKLGKSRINYTSIFRRK